MIETVYQNKKENLVVEARDAPSAALRDFLKQRVWGDRGVRFQVIDMDKKFRRKNSLFMSLKKRSEVIGSYCFHRREVRVLGKPRRALYRTGLAVEGAHGGNGYGRLLVQVAKRYFEDRSDISFSYGFIDRRNVRSLEALRAAGYTPIGSFEPVVFSRLKPRVTTPITTLNAKEKKAWKNKLHLFYEDHALVHLENLSDYFVVKRQGRIVAGVSGRVSSIRIRDLGGWFRNLFLQWLPPDAVRFLTFEGLYYEAGHEKDLVALLEGLLRRFGVYCGVLFLDPRSSSYSLFKKFRSSGLLGQLGQLGLIDKFYPADAIDVMAFGKGRDIQLLSAHPFYVAASDVI